MKSAYQEGIVAETGREVRKAGSDVSSNRKWYQNSKVRGGGGPGTWEVMSEKQEMLLGQIRSDTRAM